MLNNNEKQLASLSVVGEIVSPGLKQAYRINPLTGKAIQLPGVGGISYNVNIGDTAVDIIADHIEPGVSVRNPNDSFNKALNAFACIGNIAKVISGEGKGLTGHVTGKHGGVDHVMIHFKQPQDLEQLAIGDRIQIRSFGTGLKIFDYPELSIMNLDPSLLKGIYNLESSDNRQFVCPVTHVVPAELLGAGLGEENCQGGDVDIQMFDREAVDTFNLNTLRFGDLVAMENCDHSYGRIYRKGWISIGIVVHGCCVQAGHGPGVTTILTGPKTTLIPKLNAEANLKNLLGLIV